MTSNDCHLKAVFMILYYIILKGYYCIYKIKLNCYNDILIQLVHHINVDQYI